jgi:phosphoglycolate phosphatase-like HAD superfamily hydrolase
MQVILFDIDGTLLLSGSAGQHAIKKSLSSNFGISEPALVEIHGQTDRAIAAAFFSEHGIQDSDETWLQFRDVYLSHLPNSLEVCVGRLLPGVQELLDGLNAMDQIALGLLTGNTERGARYKLQHYGIDHFFTFGGFGDHHLSRNDVAHLAVQSATQALGTAPDPKHIWVVGDTPNDIRCGRAIDANVLAVATGSYSMEQLSEHHPNACLADFSDYDQIIRVLCG